VQSAQEVAALSGLTSGASGHREDATPDKVKDAVAHGLPLHAGWAPPASLHSDVVAIGGAEAIVIATLLSLQEKVSSSQRSLAQKWAPLKDLDRLQAELEELSLNQRISVVFLAIPSIREGAVSRRKAFLRSIEEIIVEDRQVTLAEFLVAVLVRFATKDKDGTFTLRGGPVDSSLASHGSDIGRVLSVCAHFSSDDVANREALFAAAISRLNLTSSFIADAGTSVPQFMTSLDVIRGMPPLLRGEVMRACEELVTADGVVTENEAVIMRLMAVLLRTVLPASVEPEAQT